MPQRHEKHDSAEGFTLVEISIVLVVIGLLVGGILVGRDLIKAAELRGTISQVDKYNAAVNIFRLKYNALPGDMNPSYAVAFGFFSETTLAGTPGHQDGNGLIEGGAPGGPNPVGETLSFWRHLSEANLIDGTFGVSGNAAIVPTTGLVTANVTSPSQSLPATKLTPAQYFIVYSAAGLNYLQLLPIAQVQTPASYTFGTAGVTPIQSYNIDIKLDDGMPNTGVVLARSIAFVNIQPSTWGVSKPDNCVIGAALPSDTYNRVEATGGNDLSCSLRFRMN